MKLFEFFGKKGDSMPAMITLPVADKTESSQEIVEDDKKLEDEKVAKPLTVSYATGWPIDVVYGYLHKNYEEKGFNDAMLKSDLAFRDMNKRIIKNKILMVFREINLNYDAKRLNAEKRMEICQGAGLLTTVTDIESELTVINAHKGELRRLEDDFRNNGDETSVPLQSYEVGFLRGVATVSMGDGMVAAGINREYTKVRATA